MAILVSKSDNDENFDGQGTVWVTDPVYSTCHDHAGESVTNYNKTHTAGQRYNIYGNGDYQIFRCVIRFGLVSLPAGAPVSSAVMSILAGSQVFHYTDWNFTLVDGSDCADPLVAADYGELLDDTTSLGSIAVSTITEGTRFEITLNAAGRSFVESKAGGVAIFAIRSSDDIGSIPPPDHDLGRKTEMQFSTSIGAPEADKPTLTITYTTEPEVTTNPATDLGAVAATLNGTLVDEGLEPSDCGFEWGLDTGYGITTPTEKKGTSESFSQVIGGLAPNTTYHFRAFATNSAGTSYGDDRTFTTSLIVSKAYALAREEL